MNSVIIGVGSNIKPRQNIKKAKILLAQNLKILAQSRFLTTKPFGKTNQANFINGAILIETSLKVEELRNHLKGIEQVLGRNTSANKEFGARTIDLDILVWNEKIVNKDFYERDFVRNSILELLPQLKYS